MNRLKSVGTLLEALVIVFFVAMILGQILGQPLLLGFVTTGSMQPTLDPGDGFVAVPSALSGDVEAGDVVTFRAEEVQGGGLTTHRVVEKTDRGFITKGDANPFTDQGNGEPPVKRNQVVAVAWQPGGSVLAIPGVGTIVTGIRDALMAVQQQLATLLGTGALLGTQGLAYLLLGLSASAYVADVVIHDGGKERGRETSRDSGASTRLLITGFAVAIVLAATVAMVAPSGSQEFGFVSAEFDSDRSDVIEAGTSQSTTYVLGNRGVVPVVTYLEPATDGVEIEPREVVISKQSSVNATLTLTAPPETGYYRQYLVEHRYLLVLPEPVIRNLYEIHPWLPIVAIDAVLGIPFYVIGVALMGSSRYRSRSRDRPSRLDRFRSRLSYRRADDRTE